MMKNFAVLGSPISHSLSPKIHNSAYAILSFDGEYSKYEVDTGNFLQFMAGHTPQEWTGFSLTMPLKEIGQSVCAEVSPEVIQASSLNTLVARNGSWFGYNTDIFGFKYLLNRIDFNDVSILGAGGTAKSALVALAEMDVRTTVYRRDSKRDESLRNAKRSIEIRDIVEIQSAFSASLLINTLPIDAYDSGITLSRPQGNVIDALYNPWPTPLMNIQVKGKFFSGKDLLVAQALKQIELFTHIQFQQDDLFSQLRSLI